MLAIVDASNNVVGSYTYDAWGKVLSVTGEIAQSNPIRYRGYYYDTETGLYYLNSRYYDPEIGRFVNTDNVLPNIGKSMHGNNLFTYCFNNPITFDDGTGNWPQWLKNAAKAVVNTVTQVKAILKTPSTVLKIAAVSVVALVSGKATVQDIRNDAKNFTFFNTDEEKVLDSKVFSSYKGTPVLRHSMSGVTSFSISNTIVLNRNENKNNGGMDTVKHEWGHTAQQSLIGTKKFVMRIAAPSMVGCLINPSAKTYYSLPWERSADLLGGVNRSSGYYAGSDVIAGLYLIMP